MVFAFTHVVSWKNQHDVAASFPASKSEVGTVVDLRGYEGRFDAKWRANLVRDGVPQDVVESALSSEPPGFAVV